MRFLIILLLNLCFACVSVNTLCATAHPNLNNQQRINIKINIKKKQQKIKASRILCVKSQASKTAKGSSNPKDYCRSGPTHYPYVPKVGEKMPSSDENLSRFLKGEIDHYRGYDAETNF